MARCEILTSRKVSEDTEIILNSYVAQIIKLVIGGDDGAVELVISDEQPMSFEDCGDEAWARVQVKASAELASAQSERLKKEFVPVISKFLNLSQDRIKVEYQKYVY